MIKRGISFVRVLAAALLVCACCGKTVSLETATFEDVLIVPMMESAQDSLDIQLSLEYPVGGLEDSVSRKILEDVLFFRFRGFFQNHFPFISA